MSDPYRVPGHVDTAEERRAALRGELQALQSLNAFGRAPEELQRMRARVSEICRLLAELR